MPTILELFNGSSFNFTPNSVNQTPIQQKFKGSTQEKAVKADKDTLIEQELTGIRKNTGVDLNTPRLYGSETIRIASRTTSLVEDMKAQTGGQGATGGLIGKGLGKLTGGKLNSISDVRNKFNSVLGIPVTQIPSRVSNKVIELSSANSITSQDVITKDLIGGQGSGVGKFLKGLGGGDFKTLGKQALGNGIGLAKDKLRGALFGKPQTIGEATGQKIQLTYNNTNKYSTVLKDNRDYKSEGGNSQEFEGIDIKLVSPVHGVRRKDGQFGSLKSGNSEIYGFEYIKKPNSKKPLSRWVPDSKYSKSEEFKGKTLESKRGLSNGMDIINIISPTDKVSVNKDGEFTFDGQQYADLIPFYIGKRGDLTRTMFRSNIKGITETVSPSWNSHKFLGNPYQFYTYSQIERSVSFNLQIYTSSPLELATNWEKLSNLTQMTYPSIQSNGLVSPPIIDFTLGNIYQQKIGFIDSLSYTIPDDSTWETEINGAKLPKFIDVSLSIKFIEDASSVNALYGIEKSRSALKSINDSNRANDYSDQTKTGLDSFNTPSAMNPRGLVPTPEDLKPKISISSPLTQGSIKKPYVQSIDGKSSSTTTETPETAESPASNPIVNQSAMVDGLKAETPAKAIAENKVGSSMKQSAAITSFFMAYQVNNPRIIQRSELPNPWESYVEPDDDAVFVTAKYKGYDSYFHIDSAGEMVRITKDEHEIANSPKDFLKPKQ